MLLPTVKRLGWGSGSSYVTLSQVYTYGLGVPMMGKAMQIFIDSFSANFDYYSWYFYLFLKADGFHCLISHPQTWLCFLNNKVEDMPQIQLLRMCSGHTIYCGKFILIYKRYYLVKKGKGKGNKHTVTRTNFFTCFILVITQFLLNMICILIICPSSCSQQMTETGYKF